MKKLIKQLYATTDRFTIYDFILFKVVLISIGVLLGFYLKDFLHGWIIAIWAIGLIPYIILFIRVIGYFRKNNHEEK